MIDANCAGSELSIAHAANQHLLVPALQVEVRRAKPRAVIVHNVLGATRIQFVSVE